jgi:hypothetical protein
MHSMIKKVGRAELPAYITYVPYADYSWRVSIAFHGTPYAKRKALDSETSETVAADLRSRLGDHIRISSAKMQVYLYSDTPDAARQAELVARDVLAQHRASADCLLEHWDRLGEAWREAATGRQDGPGPGLEAGREYRPKRQRRWFSDARLAGWQVRVKLPTHDEMKRLAEHLTSEGWQVIRHRRSLIAGAHSEEAANALAQEIRAFSSAPTAIRVQQRRFWWDPSPWIPIQ